MPTTYKVLIDGQDTGETVIASNYADAYFDVASTVPLTYHTDVKLVPIEASPNQHHQNHLQDEPAVTQNQNVFDNLSEQAKQQPSFSIAENEGRFKYPQKKSLAVSKDIDRSIR